jgi:hypothetical protein
MQPTQCKCCCHGADAQLTKNAKWCGGSKLSLDTHKLLL